MGIKKTKPGSGLVLRGRTMQNLSRFRGVGLAAAIGIILTFASISTASAQVWLDPNSCWRYQRLNSRTHEWEWQRSDIETGASIAKWAQQTWLKGNNIIQWKENKRYVRVPCSPRESELGLAALAIFGEVEVGGSSTTTAPQLFAPFSVASSGFVGGGSLGAYVPLPVLLPGLSVGVRGTVLGFGGNSGSAVFLQPASVSTSESIRWRRSTLSSCRISTLGLVGVLVGLWLTRSWAEPGLKQRTALL